MHSHTTEGLMQLVSEFGQCRWSEGSYGASFIAKGQERGQREEAAKLYEEIRSYATALCQQAERDAKDAALADGFDGSAIRPGWNHTTILLWYDTEEKARAAHRVIVGLVDTALSTSEGKTE